MAIKGEKEFRGHPGVAAIGAFIAARQAAGRPLAAFYAGPDFWATMPGRAPRWGVKIAGVPIREAIIIEPLSAEESASAARVRRDAERRAAMAEAVRRGSGAR